MRPTTFSVSKQSSHTFQLKLLRLALALAVMFGSAASSFQAIRGQTHGQALVFPATIQWPRQRGITWYRLQIGGDDTFQDIYQDRRVLGDRVRLSDLAPGYYYWRIASADSQLGSFSRPLRFFVSGGMVTSNPVRSTVFKTSRVAVESVRRR